MTIRGALQRLGDRVLSVSTAVLGLVGIAMLWTALLISLASTRQTALRTARNETENLARAFEEQITREIKAVDQSLLFVRENYARSPEKFDIREWARSAAAVTDYAIQLTIVDRNGWTVANSVSPDAPSVNLSDREHIRVHHETSDDKLFISKPVVGRVSHRWSIQFTRKLFDARGDFAGIAVVSLDPGYLTRFYASIDLGRTGGVTLFGQDGVVRAAARSHQAETSDLGIGHVVVPPPNRTVSFRKAMVGPVDFDHVRRVTSFQEVHAYPLVVGVGVGEDEVLANYFALRRSSVIGAAFLTVLLLIVTAAMLLHQRRLARTREELRDSERRYAEKSTLFERALEHMNQGILLVDSDQRVQVCNRQLKTMLELPSALLAQGTPFADIVRYQRDVGEFDAGPSASAEAPFPPALPGPDEPIQTYERKRPTGQTLTVCSVPMADGGVVRTYTDISDRVAFEEDLRAARDQANAAAAAKSEFLAMMSHEIRSPLSGLIGALDLLRSTKMEAEQSHMVGLAHGSALSLLAILNDILDFSKIEADALTLSVEPVDIRALISELTQSHGLVATAKSVRLQAEFGSNLPPLIHTDRLRLGQIVNNLLSNAVKFTSAGSITLLASLERSDAGTRLRLDVRDTGCGMHEATLARLFQPFMQADGSSSRTAGGTGLGLCISRSLATLLGGTLDVVSQPGVGSCFTLNIACAAEPAVAAPSPMADAPALDDALAGLRVLVVDDNPTNQWLTRRQLMLLGATVEVASDGRSALELVATQFFDAVVTDCHMPGMDGVALTSAIRRSGTPWSDIQVVGLTADVTVEHADRCRRCGMNELLYKPSSQARLAQALGRADARAEHAALAPAVFDSTILADLFDPGDPEAAEWLRAFCRSATEQVTALGRLVGAEIPDRPAIAAASHSLVGASLSVGASRLAAAVRILEAAAPHRGVGQVRQAFKAVEVQSRVAIEEISAFAARNAPALA